MKFEQKNLRFPSRPLLVTCRKDHSVNYRKTIGAKQMLSLESRLRWLHGAGRGSLWPGGRWGKRSKEEQEEQGGGAGGVGEVNIREHQEEKAP